MILLVVGLVVSLVALGFIIYYGLFTALVLFLVTGVGVLFLGLTHLVDLNKNRLLAALPFIMFGLGYVGQKFATVPLTGTRPSEILLVLLAFVILIVLAFASRRK